MENKDILYKIAISKLPKIGPVLARRLVSYAGSIENVFKESCRALEKIPGVGSQLASLVKNSDALEKAKGELDFVLKNNIQVIFYLDKEYSDRLRNCEDAPVIMYVKGIPEFNRPKILSIVGTRNPSDRGKEICKSLVEDLSKNHPEVIIVSGLAYGIDVCAHKAALEYGLKTYAVLGHGFDIMYPAAHKKVSEEIRGNGALITEFGKQALRNSGHFIQRNRIIAGLADATIVVESAEKGGSLITTDIAASYNRDVFAFPGRVSDAKSKGCNDLIKHNKAGLIESAKDLEYFMGWEARKENAPVQTELFHDFTEDEKQIIKILREKEEEVIDKLCLQLNKPSSVVSPILLDLEFKGVIKTLPGKLYKLTTKIYT